MWLFCDPRGLWQARLLCPWDFPGKNMAVGCHFPLQGIFEIQRSNPYLLHWQASSFPLSQQGDSHNVAYVLDNQGQFCDINSEMGPLVWTKSFFFFKPILYGESSSIWDHKLGSSYPVALQNVFFFLFSQHNRLLLKYQNEVWFHNEKPTYWTKPT